MGGKMSEKQMNFLDELANLLSKYSIDEVSVSKNAGSDDRIDFISNGQTLSIGYFTNGEFRHVRSFYGDYEP
jgi:hypothetical protein